MQLVQELFWYVKQFSTDLKQIPFSSLKLEVHCLQIPVEVDVKQLSGSIWHISWDVR